MTPPQSSVSGPYLTVALYKFVDLPDYQELRAPLLAVCESNQVCGTLLLAKEGINGTVAGPEAGMRALLAYLHQDPRFADLEHKEAYASEAPFRKMKVKLKREIVTLGVPGVNPNEMAGQYVKPQDWNALISDPNVVVVDVRNDYEIALGSFKGAVDPHTEVFSELPQWVEKESAPGGLLANKPKLAMFCTGGIRCEKSTAFMRMQGFDEVYHLEGGILKYLETVPAEESTWQGECYVFDERVSVGHGLKQGEWTLCRACGLPLQPADKHSPLFEEGVSCAHCHADTTEEQKARFRERQHQVELARQRNTIHMGKRPEPKRKKPKKSA